MRCRSAPDIAQLARMPTMIITMIADQTWVRYTGQGKRLDVLAGAGLRKGELAAPTADTSFADPSSCMCWHRTRKASMSAPASTRTERRMRVCGPGWDARGGS
eukprot:465806-Rhodomonas_salina.4